MRYKKHTSKNLYKMAPTVLRNNFRPVLIPSFRYLSIILLMTAVATAFPLGTDVQIQKETLENKRHFETYTTVNKITQNSQQNAANNEKSNTKFMEIFVGENLMKKFPNLGMNLKNNSFNQNTYSQIDKFHASTGAIKPSFNPKTDKQTIENNMNKSLNRVKRRADGMALVWPEGDRRPCNRYRGRPPNYPYQQPYPHAQPYPYAQPYSYPYPRRRNWRPQYGNPYNKQQYTPVEPNEPVPVMKLPTGYDQQNNDYIEQIWPPPKSFPKAKSNANVEYTEQKWPPSRPSPKAKYDSGMEYRERKGLPKPLRIYVDEDENSYGDYDYGSYSYYDPPAPKSYRVQPIQQDSNNPRNQDMLKNVDPKLVAKLLREHFANGRRGQPLIIQIPDVAVTEEAQVTTYKTAQDVEIENQSQHPQYLVGAAPRPQRIESTTQNILSEHNGYGITNAAPPPEVIKMADPDYYKAVIVPEIIIEEKPDVIDADGYLINVTPDGTIQKSYFLSADNNYGIEQPQANAESQTQSANDDVLEQEPINTPTSIFPSTTPFSINKITEAINSLKQIVEHQVQTKLSMNPAQNRFIAKSTGTSARPVTSRNILSYTDTFEAVPTRRGIPQGFQTNSKKPKSIKPTSYLYNIQPGKGFSQQVYEQKNDDSKLTPGAEYMESPPVEADPSYDDPRAEDYKDSIVYEDNDNVQMAQANDYDHTNPATRDGEFGKKISPLNYVEKDMLDLETARSTYNGYSKYSTQETTKEQDTPEIDESVESEEIGGVESYHVGTKQAKEVVTTTYIHTTDNLPNGTESKDDEIETKDDMEDYLQMEAPSTKMYTYADPITTERYKAPALDKEKQTNYGRSDDDDATYEITTVEDESELGEVNPAHTGYYELSTQKEVGKQTNYEFEKELYYSQGEASEENPESIIGHANELSTMGTKHEGYSKKYDFTTLEAENVKNYETDGESDTQTNDYEADPVVKSGYSRLYDYTTIAAEKMINYETENQNDYHHSEPSNGMPDIDNEKSEYAEKNDFTTLEAESMKNYEFKKRADYNEEADENEPEFVVGKASYAQGIMQKTYNDEESSTKYTTIMQYSEDDYNSSSEEVEEVTVKYTPNSELVRSLSGEKAKYVYAKDPMKDNTHKEEITYIELYPTSGSPTDVPYYKSSEETPASTYSTKSTELIMDTVADEAKLEHYNTYSNEIDPSSGMPTEIIPDYEDTTIDQYLPDNDVQMMPQNTDVSRLMEYNSDETNKNEECKEDKDIPIVLDEVVVTEAYRDYEDLENTLHNFEETTEVSTENYIGEYQEKDKNEEYLQNYAYKFEKSKVYEDEEVAQEGIPEFHIGKAMGGEASVDQYIVFPDAITEENNYFLDKNYQETAESKTLPSQDEILGTYMSPVFVDPIQEVLYKLEAQQNAAMTEKALHSCQHIDESTINGHLFFIGDGVKIPILLSQNQFGNIELTLDMENVCSDKAVLKIESLNNCDMNTCIT